MQEVIKKFWLLGHGPFDGFVTFKTDGIIIIKIPRAVLPVFALANLIETVRYSDELGLYEASVIECFFQKIGEYPDAFFFTIEAYEP